MLEVVPVRKDRIVPSLQLIVGLRGIRVTTLLPKRILAASSWISALRNVVWIIGAAGIVVAGVLYLTDSAPHARTAAGALVLVTAAATGGYLLRRRHTDTDASPWGYRTISTRYEFTFDKADCGRQSQEVETEIEAVRHDVSLFEAKYRWSGHGQARLALETSAQLLLTHPGMTYEGWTYYYVKLLRPLQRGEKAAIRVRQELADADRRMDFQLTRTVRKPQKLLVLAVRFPDNGPREKDIWAVERRSVMKDSGSLKLLDIQYDSTERRAELTVSDPVPGMTYAIEWTWPDYRLNSNP